MSDELKPCPFCGGAVIRDRTSNEYRSEISCETCDLLLWWANEDWNHRAETPESRALKCAKDWLSNRVESWTSKALARIEAIEKGDA